MTYQLVPIFLVEFKFLSNFFIDTTKKWEIQGDPFKMSQTSGIAPCKRRF